MSIRNFNSLIGYMAARGKFLCVGLDPDLDFIPKHLNGKNCYQLLINFYLPLIDATAQYVAAYKPNIAFFEGLGLNGLRALKKIIEYIQINHPDIIIILDGKRGDIGNSNKGYAAMAFTQMAADSLTINPYLGYEANKPFLDQTDKGIIVLCRTSNPGSNEFQELIVKVPEDEWTQITADREDRGFKSEMPRELPLYQYVAYRVAFRSTWNANRNCALVVGATYPEQMKLVRNIVGDMLILAPGVGKQGGDLKSTVENAKNSLGQGFLINVSSDVNYASPGKDFAEVAGIRARFYHEAIQAAL